MHAGSEECALIDSVAPCGDGVGKETMKVIRIDCERQRLPGQDEPFIYCAVHLLFLNRQITESQVWLCTPLISALGR